MLEDTVPISGVELSGNIREMKNLSLRISPLCSMVHWELCETQEGYGDAVAASKESVDGADQCCKRAAGTDSVDPSSKRMR